LEVTPTIVALKSRVEDIKRAELEKALGRLTRLAPQERDLIEAMASSIVNKLIHNTMITLKSEVASADAAAFVEAARRFFNLAEVSSSEDLEIEAPTTRTNANKPG
jgi:glutamyl-tRNA reductase